MKHLKFNQFEDCIVDENNIIIAEKPHGIKNWDAGTELIRVFNASALNTSTNDVGNSLLGNVMDLFKEFKKVTHLTVMRRLKCTYREAVEACEELEEKGKIVYDFDKGSYYVA